MRALAPLCCALVLFACDDKTQGPAPATTSATATAAPSADLSPTGVKPCDDYIAAAATCMQKVGASEKERLRVSIKQQRNQVTQAKTEEAKEMVGIGCEAELEALQEDPTCK